MECRTLLPALALFTCFLLHAPHFPCLIIAYAHALADVKQEKTHQNLLTGVESFNKDKLKDVTPEEKTHLPSPEGRDPGLHISND